MPPKRKRSRSRSRSRSKSQEKSLSESDKLFRKIALDTASMALDRIADEERDLMGTTEGDIYIESETLEIKSAIVFWYRLGEQHGMRIVITGELQGKLFAETVKISPRTFESLI